MEQIKLTPKEFALQQIAPYFKDPSTCGYDEEDKKCKYLTSDGRMCVAGKNMLEPEKFEGSTIFSILNRPKYDNNQKKIFKPEAVGILTNEQWRNLQAIHDAIADNTNRNVVESMCRSLGLFTYEELQQAANEL